MARKKKQPSLVMAVIFGLVFGGIIAVAVWNTYDPPKPGPKKPHYEEYDDSYGKLETPVASAKVTHILISWDGQGVKMKVDKRTREQAKQLAEKIWMQYVNDGADWKSLQAQYNEDSGGPSAVYDVTPTASLVQPFKDCSLSTEVGKARIVESKFGYHIIRRES